MAKTAYLRPDTEDAKEIADNLTRKVNDFLLDNKVLQDLPEGELYMFWVEFLIEEEAFPFNGEVFADSNYIIQECFELAWTELTVILDLDQRQSLEVNKFFNAAFRKVKNSHLRFYVG